MNLAIKRMYLDLLNGSYVVERSVAYSCIGPWIEFAFKLLGWKGRVETNTNLRYANGVWDFNVSQTAHYTPLYGLDGRTEWI